MSLGLRKYIFFDVKVEVTTIPPNPPYEPDGVTIAREIYYHVVHYRRRLLSKFQPNRTRSYVLTACGIGRVRGF